MVAHMLENMTAEQVAVAAGIVAHVAYFQRGEHHTYGKRYLQFAAAWPVLVGFVCGWTSSAPWLACIGRGWALLACFGIGLYGSLLGYRVLWHPLRQFPGPRLACVSDLWLSSRLGHNDMHMRSAELTSRYGPFVRVGSSTLLLAHPLAVRAVHGPESACRKASMYDFEQPNRGIATLDRRQHDARRRVWSRGFGDRALRGYEPRVRVFVQQLLARLDCAQANDHPVDMTLETLHFAFDVMGDLGMGQSFGMLQQGRRHDAVAQLIEGMTIMGRRLPIWLLRLVVDVAQTLMPTEATTGFLGFCYARLDELMADPGRFERPTLMAPLLVHHESLPPQDRDLSILRNDCRFIIIAGSDTVAATLALVFYYIARDPVHVDTLRRELAPLLRPEGYLEYHDIQNAPHLNAIINETLRLWPPASTIMRVTPPEGLWVADTFIPGNMTVFSSQFALGRSEAVYERPGDFVPERWYSRPEMIRERAAYAPFSIGHYGCVGRPLALMEMRMCVAECVLRYNVSFAPGFDHATFLEGIEDCMSWHLGKLDLCFAIPEKGNLF